MRKVGNYSIIKNIGSGAFGLVYLAIDANGKEVACKSISAEKTKRPG